MCLLAVLFQTHADGPLIVAANRDERLARRAEPMQVLRSATPRVLGGRDALAGGTWLAVNEHGLVAGLTNRPANGGRDDSRRSRGELPLRLTAHARAVDAVADFRATVRCAEYNPCWLLVGDRDALFYVVVDGDAAPAVTPLSPGTHVLENRPLDAVSLKAEMVRRALASTGGRRHDALVDALHGVLRSHELPEVTAAPADGASPRAPEVQAACVHTPTYGTRSTTMIVVPAERARSARVHYADGPPCATPLADVSQLWTAPPLLARGARR